MCLYILLLFLVQPELVEASLDHVAPVPPDFPEHGPRLAPELLLGHGVYLQVLEHPRLDRHAFHLQVTCHQPPLGEHQGEVLLKGETLSQTVHVQAEVALEGGQLPGGEGTAEGGAVLGQQELGEEGGLAGLLEAHQVSPARPVVFHSTCVVFLS